MDDHELRHHGREKISESRAQLESILVRPADSHFPRSHTVRMLRDTGPVWLAGIALGLMVVRPRWGMRVMRLVPLARMLRQLPI
jgi:hypothetical protein